jgi:hypothetical protein
MPIEAPKQTNWGWLGRLLYSILDSLSLRFIFLGLKLLIDSTASSLLP